MSLPDWIRRRVRERARGACEYCRLPESASYLPHHIDHVIAVQHGGSDALDNLCLCCLRCNLKKGPNIASLDPERMGELRVVELFHPRIHRWEDHFMLQSDRQIRAKTPQGRATVELLNFNAPERVQLRVMLEHLSE